MNKGWCRDSCSENEAEDSAGVSRKDVWESSQVRTSIFLGTERGNMGCVPALLGALQINSDDSPTMLTDKQTEGNLEGES